MRFDGSVAYSYHEPIAHIVKAPSGDSIALFTSRNWSTTTNRHQSHYQHAANHLVSFTVPDLFTSRYHIDSTFDHSVNLAHFRARYDAERDSLLKCTTDSWRLRDESTNHMELIPLDRRAQGATRAHIVLADLADEAQKYAHAFGLVVEVYPFMADGDVITARRNRIQSDPKRAAKREAARAAREKQDAAREAKRAIELAEWQSKQAERVAAWQAGQDVRLGYGDVGYARGALLRVNTRTHRVETSQGAECPIAHAKFALRVWRAAVDANALPWTRGENTRQDAETVLGHFRLDAITVDGDIRAGCHRIKRAELEKLETVLREYRVAELQQPLGQYATQPSSQVWRPS
jgi:hypothetical protein